MNATLNFLTADPFIYLISSAPPHEVTITGFLHSITFLTSISSTFPVTFWNGILLEYYTAAKFPEISTDDPFLHSCSFNTIPNSQFTLATTGRSSLASSYPIFQFNRFQIPIGYMWTQWTPTHWQYWECKANDILYLLSTHLLHHYMKSENEREFVISDSDCIIIVILEQGWKSSSQISQLQSSENFQKDLDYLYH